MNIQKFGAALAIFVTAGMAGGALAHADVPGSQPPAVQMAALPDTGATSHLHGTMTTAAMATDAAQQMTSSMPNEDSYRKSFSDIGFGKWWVGD